MLYIGTLFFTLLLTGPAAWAEQGSGLPTSSSAPASAGEVRHLAIYVHYRFRYEAPKEKSYEQPPRMRNLLEELLVTGKVSPPGVRLELLAFTDDPLLTQDDRLRGEAWLRAIDFGIDDVLLVEATFQRALREKGGTAELSGVINHLNVAGNQVVRQRPFSLREEISADSPSGFKARQLLLQNQRTYSPKDLAAALLAAAERRLKARVGELVQLITAAYTPQEFPTLREPILIETLWQAAAAKAASTGDPRSARDVLRRLQEHFPGISEAKWDRGMSRVRDAAAANLSREGGAVAAMETPEPEGHVSGRAARPGISGTSEAKRMVRPSQTGRKPSGSLAPHTGHSIGSHSARAMPPSPLDGFRGIRLESPIASVRQKYRLSRAPLDPRGAPAYTIEFDPGMDLVQSIRLVAPMGNIAKIMVLFSRDYGKMRRWAFPAAVEFFSSGYGRRPSTVRALTAGTRQVGSCAEWKDEKTTVTLNRFDDIGLGQTLSPPLLVLTISRPSKLLQGGVLDGCSEWDEVATLSR